MEKLIFNDGARYQGGVIWSKDDLHLPNNSYSALVQLKSPENRPSKDQNLRMKYENNVRADLDKGYVVQVLNSKDLSERPRRECNLPHHTVVNPNQPNKMRRVLIGAPKFHASPINISLWTGLDLLQRLAHISFCQYQLAVSADMEGMLLQVGVLPEDQPCLKFLCWEDPSTDVMVYHYNKQIFGAKDLPTCPNSALQRTAKDNGHQYPDALQAVLEKLYMDV